MTILCCLIQHHLAGNKCVLVRSAIVSKMLPLPRHKENGCTWVSNILRQEDPRSWDAEKNPKYAVGRPSSEEGMFCLANSVRTFANLPWQMIVESVPRISWCSEQQKDAFLSISAY